MVFIETYLDDENANVFLDDSCISMKVQDKLEARLSISKDTQNNVDNVSHMLIAIGMGQETTNALIKSISMQYKSAHFKRSVGVQTDPVIILTHEQALSYVETEPDPIGPLPKKVPPKPNSFARFACCFTYHRK